MKLVNMKNLDKESEKVSEATTPEDVKPNPYPWGLQLSFDKEEIDKLHNLADMPKGTRVNIQAVGEVIRNERRRISRESPPGEIKVEESQTIEIQVQDIALADQDNADQAFKEATKEPWEGYPR